VNQQILVKAVCIGTPAFLMHRDGAEVFSGIVKQPHPGGPIVIGRTNIEGDAQADLVNHGGPDKAVYVYPSEHLPWWREKLGYDGGNASFGENLSTAGLLETEARIGDLWQWGSAILQISQPRWPCYKLAKRTGHRDMVQQLVDSLRSGWYLRVLQTGTASLDTPIERIGIDSRGLTVEEAFRIRRNSTHLTPGERTLLRDHPHLAAAWKSGI
jgi:MOSC domain-containing protein YiiM